MNASRLIFDLLHGTQAPSHLDELLTFTLQSISRAVWRLQRSQHLDGGWGPQIEQSNLWHTAYAVLFLKSAQGLPGDPPMPVLEPLISRGVLYLEQHPEQWAVETATSSGGLPVYEVSLMARSFYRCGRSLLRRESAGRVYRAVDRLHHSQNEDGGWDANLWGYEMRTPVRVWSEVGATAFALQALAETPDGRFLGVVERGINWLMRAQNRDGSWNDGSCRPDGPAFQLTGQVSFNKTCDALQGLLTAQIFDLQSDAYRDSVGRSLAWLSAQQSALLNQPFQAGGWARRFTTADYEQSCLFLETILRFPNAQPSLAAATAAWLLQGQRCQPDDPEDGSWVLGHTARIGLALASFYRRSNPAEVYHSLYYGS